MSAEDEFPNLEVLKSLGGPARPLYTAHTTHFGISIWDEYAKAALGGLLTNPVITSSLGGREIVARAAGNYADMMLSERRKRQETGK